MRDYDSYKLHLKLLLVHLATAEKRSYDTNSVGKFRSQFHDGKSLKRIAFSLIIFAYLIDFRSKDRTYCRGK